MYKEMRAKFVWGARVCLYVLGCLSVIPLLIFAIHWLSGSTVDMHWDSILDIDRLVRIPIVATGIGIGIFIVVVHLFGRREI